LFRTYHFFIFIIYTFVNYMIKYLKEKITVATLRLR